MSPTSKASLSRLRKHAEYQQVYKSARKQFSKQMTYFAVQRPEGAAELHGARVVAGPGPRVGLTVGKVMGKAVDRNRIKRRLREAVRRNLRLLPGPVDVVLHPRRSVLTLPFGELEREVGNVFRAVQRTVGKPGVSTSGQPPQRAVAAPHATVVER